MSLRGRLVLSLVAMLAVGLTIYGLATYRSFARAELGRLDDELRTATATVARQLAGPAAPMMGDGRGHDGHRPGPPVVLPPGTYAELRAPDGRVVDRIRFGEDDGLPDLAGPAEAGVRTVGPLEGEGRWRVLTTVGQGGRALLVATPLSPVERSLARLLLIELAAGAALLLLLAGGAWLILRSGLRPLESMAAAAGRIRAGGLDRRIPDQRPGSELGMLAGALNTMLEDLEHAFREREATEQRLRRFLADASHELRTPLTSIQGFAELFRLGASEHVDQATIMRRIEEEAVRMRTLVEDLLLLARLDEPRPATVEEVDLTVLAADACSDAAATAPDRPIRLDAPAPAVVPGDRDHLRQAIANLVGNALRHTPPGTPVEVTAGVRGDAGVVSVRDFGDGLDDAALGHVFDRFWQADPARVGTGAGLGLSIVQAIAAEHDGTVVAANAPGGGAVFTLAVPRGPVAREGTPTPAAVGGTVAP